MWGKILFEDVVKPSIKTNHKQMMWGGKLMDWSHLAWLRPVAISREYDNEVSVSAGGEIS
jgi:hypothetical protein